MMRSRGWAAGLAVGLAVGFAAGRWSATAPSVPVPRITAGHAPVSDDWTVVRVIDGDTLVVRSVAGEEHVRLRAVNTPERGQSGFEEATEVLRGLARAGAAARLEYEKPGVPERDRYGRILAYVVIGGVNTSVEVARSGWSEYETRYGPSRFDVQMQEAEREARGANRGVWAGR
ncbi:MAG: thermonuclease family protein [Phycisphaerales bacterium]|nr:thermonuclease family protein [Phycisphaerales bacterium]